MRLKSLLLLAALAGMLTMAQVAAETGTHVVKGFEHPESVLIDGPRRFVSNLGATLDPLGHDGDGFISELDAGGGIVTLRAFPRDGDALDAPKGMTSLGGTLYVTDIDRIVGFDLETRQQVFEARAPGEEPSLLNDIAARKGALIVSDSVRGTLYQVDTSTGAFTELAEGVLGANGVVWDAANDRVLVVGLGAAFEGGDLFEVLDDGMARKLKQGPHGILDGVALLSDGRVVISNWRTIDPPSPGVITFHAVDGSRIGALDPGVDILGPADFAVDDTERSIWIPAMVDGALVIAPLSP